jgi:hypothetical protein
LFKKSDNIPANVIEDVKRMISLCQLKYLILIEPHL